MAPATTEIHPRKLMASRKATLDVAALGGIVALGAAIRIVGLGAAPLWLDEALSWSFATHPLGEIWSWAPTLDGANPPLYYTLLHAWLALGDSAFDLRLLSLVASVAAIPVTFALGRLIGGPRLGLLTALLATVSPFALQYAQEARAYALLLLAATLMMWSLATLLTQPNAARQRLGTGLLAVLRSITGPSPHASRSLDSVWLVFILSAAASLLLHDTAFLLLIAVDAVALLWLARTRPLDRAWLGNWCLAQLAIGLLWLPWLPGFVSQAHEVQAAFWIPFPTLDRILGTGYQLLADQTFIGLPTGGQWILAGAIVGGLVALILAGLYSFRISRRWLVFLVPLLILAPAAEVALSILRPLLLTRTLIWTTVPLALLIAAGVLSLRPIFARGAALAFVLSVSLWGVWNYLTIPQKEAWDQAAAYVAMHASAGDGVLFVSASTRVPFDYYFRDSSAALDEHGLPREVPPNHFEEQVMTPADEPSVAALASEYPHVWLVSSVHAEFTDPSGLILSSIARVDDLVATEPFTGGLEVYLFVRRGTAEQIGGP